MKPVIKLAVKSFCVMLPLFVICGYFHKNPLGYTDNEAPYYMWNREFTNIEHEKYYGTIILGDSHANSDFIPEVLSDTTVNLSLGGITPIESYYILRNWLDHNKAPQTCYISFYDIHFIKSDFFWSRVMYSHLFPINLNFEIIKEALKYEETSIIGEHYIQDFLSYELRLPNKYIASFMNGSFNQRGKENIAMQQKNALHNGRYVGMTSKEYSPGSKILTYKKFPVEPMFDEYFRKMIELCLDNQINVRIVITPLPDNAVLTDGYVSNVLEYYDNLKKDYPGITVDWFSTYEKNYFYDSHHMNTHGALKFSLELKELYPDDFLDDEMSAERVAAINDYIKNENKLEEILKWIYGKKYTVALYDGTNTFKTLYEERIKSEVGNGLMELYEAASEAEEKEPAIYYLSGLHGEGEYFPVYQSEKGFTIEIGNGKVLEWEVSVGDKLSIAVIDRYNDEIVCTTNFEYIGECYNLI